MARGKHKNAKRGRDARALGAALAAARAELEGEQQQLEQAQAELADVDALRARLASALTDRDTVGTAEAVRVGRDVEVLTALVGEVDDIHARIKRRWSSVVSVITEELGGGQDGLERLLNLTRDSSAYLVPEAPQRRLDAVGMERVQRARGERRRSPADERVEQAQPKEVMQSLLRRRWRAPMDDLRARAVDGPVTLGAEPQERLIEAQGVFGAVWQSRASDTGLDAVHAWHPMPSLRAEPDTSPVLASLGAGLIPRGRGAGVNVGEIPSQPVLSLPATTRARLAAGSVEDLAAVWEGSRRASAAAVQASGRIPRPWSAPVRYPRPGDAVAIKHWYTLAGLGAWSRAVDDDPEAESDTALVAGEVAVGLAAAAPFWLPPGQTAGYVDSEPLSAEDLDELRMPFAQILLVLADPLHLPPSPTASDGGDGVLGIFDDAMLRAQLTRNDEPLRLRDLIQCAPRPAAWAARPTLAEVLTRRGAQIEAVLLLADALGRLQDTFAWCVAVPARGAGLIGRYVIPARRSTTAYRDQVTSLAAVAAWADWHPPEELVLPPDATTRELAGLVESSAFRSLEARGGAGSVRVLDIVRTAPNDRGHDNDGGVGRTVAPHVRRGHWRRQRHGPSRQLVKRVRIAPIMVNAGKAGLAPQIYRLPTAAGRAGPSDLPPENGPPL